MMDIANLHKCSIHKVQYWMDKYDLKRRTISDATYLRNNLDGDPFMVKAVTSTDQVKHLGIGIGLYWGEGNKANKWFLRLGNTNAALLRMFIRFLVEIFEVKKDDMRFTL